jgi:hypothetical protein
MKTTIFLLVTLISTIAVAPLRADDPVVPSGGFPASRYEALWTKSPFAVATAEASPDSPDYSLVGVANIEGVFYASVIEIKSQEHFLLSSGKPSRGLTLTSITRSPNGLDSYAIVQKDGQTLTLKLEQAQIAVAGGPTLNLGGLPGNMTPPLPMPGAGPSYQNSGLIRFPVRIRHPLIHMPPRPELQQQPPPPPVPAP